MRPASVGPLVGGRLWRIDDARVKLDSELLPLFGQNVTLGDISRTKPTSKLGEKDAKATLAVRIADLEKLAARLRRQSLSMLRDFVRRLETT